MGKRAAGESTTKLLALVLVGIMAILLGYALGNLGIKMMTSSRPAVAPTGPGGGLQPPMAPGDQAEGLPTPPREEGGLLQTLEGEGQAGTSPSQAPAQLFRVRVGPFADRAKAQQAAQKLERAGYEVW
ncbi:MAG: SPOR domain-containing protein, partial [Bacillota bacterium]|nr:SPOR domain-containing protein [Bacillota bacterium]